MRVTAFIFSALFASALAETSGYCCTKNSNDQVVSHNDQTRACCNGRWDGTECWVASNLDPLTKCCRSKGSAMCAF
ncbi:uncharacterized protein CTRU02_211329 [Colletotrichum truncatum]|uniref:Uncharacterized protein n=1 Tax=Colletotrichum truncatum TaxID=5467 RepID=A0ACC3YRK0_COLTU|nr:uncharacterized protein CTRU02_02106 [Colletotrichum truncatum]KAF6799235.1 hypothetical protein CTRU02_02106 [Colletotrichum truncatum]